LGVIAFWVSTSVIVYTWFGYIFILEVLVRVFHEEHSHDELQLDPPTVSVIVAVRNGASFVADKITNTLECDYVSGRLEVIVVSDGSTDDTFELAARYSASDDVKVLKLTNGGGKTAAQNEGVLAASGDVIFFTNVDTLLAESCLVALGRRFTDPAVGCVAAKVAWAEADGGVAASGDLYWKLEQALWKRESKLGIMAWASGAAMAVRRELIPPMDPRYGEDCVLPLILSGAGNRVVYEPDAIAYDSWASTPAEEYAARRRMTLRSFAGTISQFTSWAPWTNPKLAWAVFSHKLLRWMTPFFLVALFLATLLSPHSPLYLVALGAQFSLYCLALLGWLTNRLHRRIPFVAKPFNFCLAMSAMASGLIGAIRGQQLRRF
jgi:cellulose synthase/poly-beta-1,6-N-acetylglucosamine synthase-like glycosyltransferase